MANKLLYSFTNPLQFFSRSPDIDARFNSKDFEDFEFPETILPWEQRTGYCQPWQLNDTIPLQLQTNVGPVNWILKDCKTNRVIATVQLDQKQQSVTEPGLYIYELSAPLAAYAPGCYYAVLDFNGIFQVYTGELNFEAVHDGTILAEYKHFESREDIIFETGWLGCVRIPAVKDYIGPKQKATTYEDQVLNMSALRSQKFREFALYIGQGKGIPNYFADMIGGIIGCSDFRLDGKNYTVPSDTDMEAQKIPGVALRWWTINPIRERYTRGSREFENDDPLNGQIAVEVNVDSKGFGNSNTGSQTIITDVF